MNIVEYISQPWSWYVGGPLIGLTVGLLLIVGNKQMGVSSSFRHICAAIIPRKIKFFNYDWESQSWNLWFVLGIVLGGMIGSTLFLSTSPIEITEGTKEHLRELGVTNFTGYIPSQIFSFENLLTPKGFMFQIIGGFCVGFGTRYAGGCTSGHTIMGLSNFQLPSLIASISFFIGGLLMTYIVLPLFF